MARQRTNSPRKADWERTSDHLTVSPAQVMKDRREQLGMSQGELAYGLGYTNPNFISILEMGHSKVPLDKAFLIAEVLRLPPYWFLERTMAGFGDAHANLLRSLFGPGGGLHDLYQRDLERAKVDVELTPPYAKAA